jgi:hypothetical protein
MKMDKNNCKYIKSWAISLLVAIPLLIMFFPLEGDCNQNAGITVQTILASNGKSSVDPRLKGLVQELNSVFRYSSYESLGQKTVNLGENKKAVVGLPEGRKMNITSKGIKGNRVTLQIEIYKGNSKIFQTVIQLRNNASITIGGPGYKGGNLLFNIYTSF